MSEAASQENDREYQAALTATTSEVFYIRKYQFNRSCSKANRFYRFVQQQDFRILICRHKRHAFCVVCGQELPGFFRAKKGTVNTYYVKTDRWLPHFSTKHPGHQHILQYYKYVYINFY